MEPIDISRQMLVERMQRGERQRILDLMIIEKTDNVPPLLLLGRYDRMIHLERYFPHGPLKTDMLCRRLSHNADDPRHRVMLRPCRLIANGAVLSVRAALVEPLLTAGWWHCASFAYQEYLEAFVYGLLGALSYDEEIAFENLRELSGCHIRLGFYGRGDPWRRQSERSPWRIAGRWLGLIPRPGLEP